MRSLRIMTALCILLFAAEAAAMDVYVRALELIQTGSRVQAIAVIEQELDRGPVSADAYLLVGSLLREDKKLAAARARFEQGWQQHRDPRIGVELATTESWLGQLQSAQDRYAQVLKHYPDNRQAKLGLARVLTWAGEFSQAEDMYQTMLASNANDADALVGLANIRRADMQTGESETLYKKALETAPEHHEALHGLSELKKIRIWESSFRWRTDVVTDEYDHAMGARLRRTINSKVDVWGAVAGQINKSVFDTFALEGGASFRVGEWGLGASYVARFREEITHFPDFGASLQLDRWTLLGGVRGEFGTSSLATPRLGVAFAADRWSLRTTAFKTIAISGPITSERFRIGDITLATNASYTLLQNLVVDAAFAIGKSGQEWQRQTGVGVRFLFSDFEIQTGWQWYESTWSRHSLDSSLVWRF